MNLYKMNLREQKYLIPSYVLSPTPIGGVDGLSISVIFLFGKNLTKALAVIQPAEPPPTITIFSMFPTKIVYNPKCLYVNQNAK